MSGFFLAPGSFFPLFLANTLHTIYVMLSTLCVVEEETLSREMGL